jgi:light-regulated signal transduction histidine kinase (bacteriophytochrome)
LRLGRAAAAIPQSNRHIVRPMNILMLSDVYFPRVDGVSSSIRTFAREFEQLGHASRSWRRSPAPIEVSAEQREDGRIHHYVRDNGAGFDMASANRLLGVLAGC